MNIFINILKIMGIVVGVIFFIFLMIYLPQKLLEDRTSKAEIDEGKYILNLLADEYEKLLSQRRDLLQKETARLLSERGITRTLAEKKIIELKLSELEKDRRYLNKEYNETLLKRKEIENTVANLRMDLESSSSEIIQLNKKYLNLVNEKEKQDSYWKKYINDIKERILFNYKNNSKKSSEIEISFAKNNGKEFIINEIFNFDNTISRLQNQIQSQKDNINTLKISESDLSNENKDLKIKLEDYEKRISNLENSSEIISKYEKINYSFLQATRFLDNKKYSNAIIEYNNVINIIDKVKISYENLQKIKKDLDNEKAKDLYDKAVKNISNKRYNFAINLLETIIRDTPNSDYTNDALRSILSISNQTIDIDKIASQNEGAKNLITSAEAKIKNNNFSEALELYYNVILNYQYSIYTEQALKNIINMNKTLLKNRDVDFHKELKKTFKENYDVYIDYYKKGYYEKARNFYFEILNKVFGDYSNNSILPFKEFEDEYIEMLIENYKYDLQLR